MISGACFLDIKKSIDVKTMFRKYIMPIVILLVFWGIFYYFFDLWLYPPQGGVEIKHILLSVVSVVSGKSGYHLWFLYTILALYLIVPVLQKLVLIMDRAMWRYLIVIFFIFGMVVKTFNALTALFPKISFLHIGLELICFTDYSMCFLLGYFLNHYGINSKIIRRMLYIAASAGLVIMPLGNCVLSLYTGQEIMVLSDNTGIFNTLLAVAIFIFIKRLEPKLQTAKSRDIYLIVGKCTLGIYVLHVAINSLLFHKLNFSYDLINPIFSILIYGLLIFIISGILTFVLKKIPIVQKLV